MRAIRFGVLSLIGTAFYATVIASLGYAVGSAWHGVVAPDDHCATVWVRG